MIEEVLHPVNLMRAYRQVVQNKGVAGVNGMQVEALYGYLQIHWEGLKESIRAGRYLPQPIRGVEIPGSNGQKHMPGILTVVDRMLQQATGRILCNCYEMSFEESSYGFRPNRSAQQAVRRSLEYIKSGNTHIVDIDLKNFFDEVDHSLLLQILYRKVKCRPTLRMIRKWLRAPIQIDGKPVKCRKGLPQGSPLSPILSNIMLDELDRELKRTGVKYVRYADDFSIYGKEERESEEVRNRRDKYLKEKLHLPINEDKSGIRSPEEFTIPGYSFVRTPGSGEKNKY